MAGIALVLDLLKRNQKVSAQSLHSYGQFSAAVAASAAAASVAAAGRPFASRFLFGDAGITVAYCDAGAAHSEDYVLDLHSAKSLFHHDYLKYRTKEYPIELKPLFSAFGLKSLAITSLRSFLTFYLPLLEPRPPVEEDDDFLSDAPEERPLDLVVPFQDSVKQIIRETSVGTTRRMLERLAVHYCSQRMAWKLLKDVRRSAKRKAERGVPTLPFFYSVCRTSFRGNSLGAAASWCVQILIEIYRCFVRKPNNNNNEVDISEKIRIFGRKVYVITVYCSGSLVFASVGAGIGAIFHPSTGQWIGWALGDFAGPKITAFCFEMLRLPL